ncbi:MAG: TetR/AcrR family transcriptional regulator [Ignavibacteriaceae bacterium]
MNEDKNKILDFALETFTREGFYKTSMDDIAARLHISKKTIYRNFSSKEELVRETTLKFLNQYSSGISEIIGKNFDSVSKLVMVFESVGNLLMRITNKWMEDIQNYAPNLWKVIDDFRTKKMGQNLSKLISQGKKEDYIVDLPSEIIIAVFTSSIRGVVNPDFIMNSRYSAKEALETTICILMNGILTAKGKRIFRKLKNNGANR